MDPNLIFGMFSVQVPEILHSLPAAEVFRLRQQTQLMWVLYLSSVHKIVHTALGKAKDDYRYGTYLPTLLYGTRVRYRTIKYRRYLIMLFIILLETLRYWDRFQVKTIGTVVVSYLKRLVGYGTCVQ